MKTLEYLYQETQIHFLFNPSDKNVMVNATEMAKLFGKRTSDYLENKSTKDLISELELTLISVNSEIKILDNRGHMGMYFHRWLAIDFASWLDVKFRVWILETLDQILFGKQTKLAEVVQAKETKKARREELVTKAVNDGNADMLEYLALERDLKALANQQKKAMQELTGQYSLQL